MLNVGDATVTLQADLESSLSGIGQEGRRETSKVYRERDNS